MRQNILIAPAVAGVADGTPLAHAAAVAVAVDIKDKAVQIGVVADREALAAQAAPVNALAGQQILAEPAPADGADARVRADLDLGDPAVLVGGLDREPAVGVHAGQVNVHHIADAVLQRLAGEAGRAAGIAVRVPVAGHALVIRAVHGLQPGAVIAPDLGSGGRAGAGRRKVRREADLPVVGNQHMGYLLRGGQRGSARLGTQHRRVARLADDPAVGRHALSLVGFGGCVGAQLVLGHHGQALHQIHRLGRAVHRHVDGLPCAAVVGLRSLGGGGCRIGCRPIGGGGIRRGLGGRRRGAGLDLIHRHGLLGQTALSALVQVGLRGGGRAGHVGQARQQLVGAGQQAVRDGLQVVRALGQVRHVRGGVAARAAVLAGGLGGGALLGVAVHTGLHQRADRRHRLALALILGRRQQRLLRCRDGRGV